MTKTLLSFFVVFTLASGLVAQSASAPTISQLFDFSCNGDFSSCAQGFDPTLSPVQLADGFFYGVTWWAGTGSSNNGGTVWKATSTGKIAALHTFAFNASGKFPAGENPVMGFAAGADGNLYGTTEQGGSANFGVFYKLTPSGKFTVLHNFCTLSGCPDATGKIILAKDGNFYGAEFRTIFELTPAGAWSQIFLLDSTTETFSGNLIQGTDGNFYGTGTASELAGFVFSVTPGGEFNILYQFPQFTQITSNLIQASDGNFYGATSSEIFQLTPAGVVHNIHEMTAAQGLSPSFLMQGSDGNLYGLSETGGTASDRPGTFFSLTLSGTFLQSQEFSCKSTGCNPTGMVEGKDGNFYGNAITEGTAPNRHPLGTFFEIATGLKAQ